jgi:hypothetical protein
MQDGTQCNKKEPVGEAGEENDDMLEKICDVTVTM